jgi:Na+/proline symporter
MSSSILGLLNSVYSFLAAACFVPFVGGVLWKKGNSHGAVAASVVGVATVLVGWMGVSFPAPMVFPILPSAVAYAVVSLGTQGQGKEAKLAS